MRIAIIGGGVVGLCCAFELASAGHPVTVFDDRGDDSAPSWNNAGHIATEQTAPLASLAALRSAPARRFRAGGALSLPPASWRAWLPFAWRMAAAARPRRFAAGQNALTWLLANASSDWTRLAAAIEDPALYREAGHLIAWESAESAARGRAAWEAARTGTASIHPASAADRALLNSLTDGRITDAVRCDGSGQISDLGRLASTLRAAVAARGGRMMRSRAELVVARGTAKVTGHDAGLVLVAAGVASGKLLGKAGYRTPIIAERGYHVRTDAEAWPSAAPPIVFEDRSMIVTRFANAVQASSFVELAEVDAPPDPAKWRRLEHHIAALGLPIGAPFTRWMGARPTLPDYLPAIGRSRHVPNLLYAFGHQHLGLTLAAVTARLVACLVAGASEPAELAAFSIERFGRWQSP